jgi:hypothetical protein
MVNYYAKVEKGLVVFVGIIESKEVEKYKDKEKYLITHNNIIGGKPERPSLIIEDKEVLKRKNFARVGFKYDKELDAFIPPQPYPSWKFDTDTCLWNAPIPYPDDNKQYIWNESEQEWTYTGYYFEDGEIKKEE